MAAINLWTREQLLVAFTLYSQIPFGRLHANNPDIIHYAGLIGRTPSALAMKLVNLASNAAALVSLLATGDVLIWLGLPAGLCRRLPVCGL